MAETKKTTTDTTEVKETTPVENTKSNEIDIVDFVYGYNKCTSDALKTRYIKEKLKIKNYVPFALKKMLCKNIVEASCFEEQANGTKVVKVDSCTKHIIYVTTIINVYTNINIPGKTAHDAYDLLKTSGLWKVIFGALPDEDVEEFGMVLDMTYDDFMTNNYETHAFITDNVNRLSTVLGAFLAPGLEKLDGTIQDLDPDKVVKFVEKIKKYADKNLTK